MAMTTKDRAAYRADDMQDHTVMSNLERRQMLATYLPADPMPSHSETETEKSRRSRLGIRQRTRKLVYFLFFTLMHAIFSVYIHCRRTWHALTYRVRAIFFYHYQTPNYIFRDVKELKRKPKHLSVILTQEGGGNGLEKLIDDVADIATWCVCAGIPKLSVYERTGILKRLMPQVMKKTRERYKAWFGAIQPGLRVTAPHSEDHCSFLPSPNYAEYLVKEGVIKPHEKPILQEGVPIPAALDSLDMVLISEHDGREAMVDLTKTLAVMAQRSSAATPGFKGLRIGPSDVSMELIDTELSEGILSEPDQVIIFGPRIHLDGYPPWQIRLSEVFCLPDNESGVGYQVFRQALWRYTQAQFRKGK